MPIGYAMSRPEKSMTMREVMSRWPGTVPAIIRHRLHCVGCPISIFHTVEEAAIEHGLEVEAVMNMLEDAIEQTDIGRQERQVEPDSRQAHGGG